MCLVMSHVPLFAFFHSGKTIPNGTDKNQLGTPENEGKFQKCPLFTVKNLEDVKKKRLSSYLVVGLHLLGTIYNDTIISFFYPATFLTTAKLCFHNDSLVESNVQLSAYRQLTIFTLQHNGLMHGLG